VENEPTFMSERPVILDIGGEGRHPEAWNLNPRSRKTLGQQRGELIPRLIQGRGDCIPLPDRTVDVLIVERTPLRLPTLSEMLRVASPAARIILRHANAHRRDPHRLAVQVLKGDVGHPIIDVRHQFVWLCRDDRGRVDHLIASMPMLGQTSKGEWLVVFQPQEALMNIGRQLPPEKPMV
jgi:hypothetical protein